MTSSFNWEETLRIVNNKENIANDLANMLEKELPIFQQQLQIALTNEDIEAIRHHIHKLHGACCYFSVPKLKNLVQSLEKQIKTPRPNEPNALNKLVHEICNEIDQVLQALRNRNKK